MAFNYFVYEMLNHTPCLYYETDEITPDSIMSIGQKRHFDGSPTNTHSPRANSFESGGRISHSWSNDKPFHSSKRNTSGTSHATASMKRPSKMSAAELAMMKARSELPIYPHTSAIRRTLNQRRDVLLLVGETGSGKSTQVPQYILSEPWCKRRIAITQPRKVAAVSLARRVAYEMSSPLGNEDPASLVGYSVRFDQNVSPGNRLKYLTEGMLLQEIMRDPWLTEYSCVIVDEVHERGVNCDLILGFLRRLLTNKKGRQKHRGGEPLKVVVMSATAEVETLYEFFAEGYGEKRMRVERITPEEKQSAHVDSKQPINGEGVDGHRMSKDHTQKRNDEDDKPLPLRTMINGRQDGSLDRHDKHQSRKDEALPAETIENADFGPKTERKQQGEKHRKLNPTRVTIHDKHRLNGRSKHPSHGGSDKSSALKAVIASLRDVGQSPIRNDLTESQVHDQPASPNVIEAFSDHISTHYVEGRQHPVETFYLPEPAQEYIETALATIFQIHHKEPLPGDILVFLPGQDVIESLESLIIEKAAELPPNVPKLRTIPLFAALSHEAQQAVFRSAGKNTRKIVLATNIAETSVTIPGVRLVIDCGLAKLREYRSSLGLDSLLVKPISRSSAIQRQGRAGREAPGKCYRLYTEKDYLALEEANTPEILRSDLAHAILTMKARRVEDPLTFPLLSPPPSESLRRACCQLLRLGALDDKGAITSAGKLMSRLPLSPPLSRVIIAAADMDSKANFSDGTDQRAPESSVETSSTLAVIDIIAVLDSEQPFLSTISSPSSAFPVIPIESHPQSRHTFSNKDTSSPTSLHKDTKTPQTDSTTTETVLNHRLDLQKPLHSTTGDHLTLLSILRAYAAQPLRDRARFAEQRHLNHRALGHALRVRAQLRAQAVQSRLLSKGVLEAAQALEKEDSRDTGNDLGRVGDIPPTSPQMSENILRCFLQGFPSNVAVLRRRGSEISGRGTEPGTGKGGRGGGGGGMGDYVYRTVEGAREVAIHASSVMRGRKCEAIVFHELTFTTRCYAKGVSAVELGWWGDVVGCSGGGGGG